MIGSTRIYEKEMKNNSNGQRESFESEEEEEKRLSSGE